MSEEQSRKGQVMEPADEVARREAIDHAVDYRGDVTVTLDDGSEVVGFLFNHAADAGVPYVEYYPPEAGAGRERFAPERVRRIAFSGRDTADGRSWEAWVAKQSESGKA